MDKKTLIVIAISVVVITVWIGLIQPMITGGSSIFQPKSQQAAKTDENPRLDAAATPAPAPTAAASAAPAPTQAPAMGAAPKAAKAEAQGIDPNADIPAIGKKVTISTSLVDATFDNMGGLLVSYKLKKHLDAGNPVELILGGDQEPYFFSMAFGDMGAAELREPMRVARIGDYGVEFSRTYSAPGPGGASIPFILRKTFTFKPDEYMFELKIAIENSVNAVPSLGASGYAYTVFLGPQIGPHFKKFSSYGESRKYYSFANGKRKSYAVKAKSLKKIEDRVVWASVVGKYFNLSVVPDATTYAIAYNTNLVPGLENVSQMSLSRPPVPGSITVDTLRVYLGPNLVSETGRYDKAAKNGWGFADLKLEKVLDTNNIFAWLEVALKWLMELFYKILPNWGVSIILVTLLVKIIFFPLTLKGSIGTAKMAELQPKMAELQAKYKDKPDKLNAEMMAFYKREGYNPLSGCLPLLIQMPLFFAMYNLFNTHFDLRAAMFIPGWISDLSLPDSIFSFQAINIFGLEFSAIRLLPIIYLVSQLLYGKYTQSTATPGQNATQMKIMLYAMPAIFFFVLYNAPSGLLVYWITSNVLTIAQQMVTNRIIHNRKLKAQGS